MGTPSSPESQALTDAYTALNRNDLSAFIQLLDPQIERIEFAGLPQACILHGLAAVTAHFSKARATWAEGACTPERFIVTPSTEGARIIVFVHVRVRLKSETDWREGDLADVFTFRNSKVIHWRTFADQREGLEWAGAQ